VRFGPAIDARVGLAIDARFGPPIGARVGALASACVHRRTYIGPRTSAHVADIYGRIGFVTVFRWVALYLMLVFRSAYDREP
jgi:hypothetical protein